MPRVKINQDGSVEFSDDFLKWFPNAQVDISGNKIRLKNIYIINDYTPGDNSLAIANFFAGDLKLYPGKTFASSIKASYNMNYGHFSYSLPDVIKANWSNAYNGEEYALIFNVKVIPGVVNHEQVHQISGSYEVLGRIELLKKYEIIFVRVNDRLLTSAPVKGFSSYESAYEEFCRFELGNFYAHSMRPTISEIFGAYENTNVKLTSWQIDATSIRSDADIILERSDIDVGVIDIYGYLYMSSEERGKVKSILQKNFDVNVHFPGGAVCRKKVVKYGDSIYSKTYVEGGNLKSNILTAIEFGVDFINDLSEYSDGFLYVKDVKTLKEIEDIALGSVVIESDGKDGDYMAFESKCGYILAPKNGRLEVDSLRIENADASLVESEFFKNATFLDIENIELDDLAYVIDNVTVVKYFSANYMNSWYKVSSNGVCGKGVLESKSLIKALYNAGWLGNVDGVSVSNDKKTITSSDLGILATISDALEDETITYHYTGTDGVYVNYLHRFDKLMVDSVSPMVLLVAKDVVNFTSQNRVQEAFDKIGYVDKDFVEVATGIDYTNVYDIIDGTISIDNVVVDSYLSKEERQTLINLISLPKNIVGLKDTIDIETRKPKVEGMRQSALDFAHKISDGGGYKDWFMHLPITLGVINFTLYLRGIFYFSDQIVQDSPFVAKIDKNFEISLIKNDHINNKVYYACNVVHPCVGVRKTYDGVFPLTGEAVVSYGLDWCVSEDDSYYYNYRLKNDDCCMEVIRIKKEEDNAIGKVEAKEAIPSVSDDNKGKRVIYSIVKRNDGSIEVTYKVLDDRNNDITDQFFILQAGGVWLHKDIENGGVQ